MPRPQLTSEELDDFREAACNAALQVITDSGLDGLTFRELGKRLGCSYAKPFRHFGDKHHLIDAVRAEAFDAFSAYISGEDPAAVDVPMFERYLRFAATQPAAFEIMFSFRLEYVSAETRHAEDRAWEICSKPFHDWVASGQMTGDPEKLAHVAWVALHGLSALTLSGQLTHGMDQHEIGDELRKLLTTLGPAET